jgi:uncharacterized protein (TIGR02118 family)
MATDPGATRPTKLMFVVRRDADDEAATDAAAIHEQCRRLPDDDRIVGWTANVADVSQEPTGGGAPSAEAVVSVHVHPDADAAALAGGLLPGLRTEAYLVDERLIWDRHGDWPLGQRAVGFNRVALVPRRASITHEQFAAHWTDIHGVLAVTHHPGIARYVQNVVTQTLTPGAPEWDGIAELHFVRTTDFTERMYDSPEGRELIRDDVLQFIEPSGGERFLLGRWTILRNDVPSR